MIESSISYQFQTHNCMDDVDKSITELYTSINLKRKGVDCRFRYPTRREQYGRHYQFGAYDYLRCLSNSVYFKVSDGKLVMATSDIVILKLDLSNGNKFCCLRIEK